MRSVSASAGFSAPDFSDTTPQQTPPGPRDARGAAPFASVLATRLTDGPTRPGIDTEADGEHRTIPDDGVFGAVSSDAHATAIDASLVASTLVGATLLAASPTTTNVRRVTRDVTTLAPALRERLGRVVARMQDEYGYKVQVAEAGRTQARQDFLFAQGRTRSGPVVTWTRDSAHTRGRAVDVTIDGSYDNPIAFARLQQIAQAEGLHTLGVRDPGHLQLPRDIPGGTVASAAAALGTIAADGGARVTVESFGTRTEFAPTQAPTQAPTAVASVAAVANVATVAGVAQVAAVAGLAAPGALSAPSVADEHTDARREEHETLRVSGRDSSHLTGMRGQDAPHTAVSASTAQGDAAGDSAKPEDGADTSGRGHGARTVQQPRTPNVSGSAAPAWTAASAGTASTAADASHASPPVEASGPVLGAIAAERIARVLDAQQAAAPRTVSHLTLRVERAEGGEDRIRLDLRGRAVDARIDVGDVGTADQLAGRATELRAALAQHGFTTDDVRVQSSASVALAAGSRDSSRDPSGRDPNGRNDRTPDERPPDRTPRDGASRDDRQNRRPPADAYLDRTAPGAIRRPTT